MKYALTMCLPIITCVGLCLFGIKMMGDAGIEFGNNYDSLTPSGMLIVAGFAGCFMGFIATLMQAAADGIDMGGGDEEGDEDDV